MKRVLLTMTLGLLASLFAAGVVAAQTTPVGTPGARCYPGPPSGGFGAGTYPMAQTFSGGGGKLTSVELYGGASGDGTRLEVMQVTPLGVPDETRVLASVPVAPGQSLVVIPYEEAPTLNVGPYALVLLPGAAWEGYLNNPCPDGQLWIKYPQGWEPYRQDADGAFRTYWTPIDTTRPVGSVSINDGALRTTTRAVTLTLSAHDDANYPTPGSGVRSMRLRNAGGNWKPWEPYATTREWTLSRGEGKKTVQAQFRDAAGNVSATDSDSITYRR